MQTNSKIGQGLIWPIFLWAISKQWYRVWWRLCRIRYL